MLASAVLQEARYALSDLGGNRWSDARLLSLLNDAIHEVATRTKLFNDKGYVKLINNVAHYDISAYAFKIRRVEYLGIELEFKSHDEMDEINPTWRRETGTKPQYIVYDKDNFSNFKVYPIVTEVNYNNVDSNSLYGLITDIAYEDLELTPTDIYGDLDVPTTEDYLYIYYISRHTEITDVGDTVSLDAVYKYLLAHFIASKAYLDNKDTQSLELSNYHDSKFEDKLSTFSNENSDNNTQANTGTQYNSLG